MSKLVGLGLLVGLLVGASAAIAIGESATTHVVWTAGGSWIQLTAHDDVDLGTISEPDEELEDTSGNNVQVKTNNGDGFVLTVKATATGIPDGFPGDLLADFEWKVANAPGGPHVSDVQETYTVFSGLDDPMTVGRSSKPGTTTFGMGYKYSSDEDDIPGSYTITLEYTATAQ